MGSSLGRTGHESETGKVGRVRVCWTMPILPQVSQGKAGKEAALPQVAKGNLTD